MSISDTRIKDLYSTGRSCADIAFIDRCSETSIYHKLKSIGVTMRSRSEANKIFPDSITVVLYNIGLSVSQIGRLLGVDPSTVTKRLRTLHFPLRSRNVASRIRYTEDEFKRHFMAPDVLERICSFLKQGEY